MTHHIPSKNWHIELADAIERATDGDTIIIADDFMRQLGERAIKRMCPGKKLDFKIEKGTEPRDSIIKQVTKKLVDDGKIIEAGFMGLVLACKLEGVSPTELSERRKTFFAGALHLFSSIMVALEPGAEPSEKDVARMELIHKELDAFQKEFEKTVEGRN